MQSTMLFLLISLSVFSTTFAVSVSDKLAMTNLMDAITPTPSGWSSATNFCLWRGVKCDSTNRVRSLRLASQSLSGALTLSLNSLSRLTILSLQHNNFSGTLPSLANLYRLRKIYLHDNSFTSIPKNAFSRLINLRILHLSDNVKLIPWPFPSEIINSPKLTAFYTANANIIGSIPDIFGTFPCLVNLTLSYNNLTGLLPNSFIGSTIQNLKVDNQKSGLTGSIDVLTGMNHLSLVWIQGNKFTGLVPSSFVSLRRLSHVRLENNQFQGPISHFPEDIKMDLGAIVPNSFHKNNDNVTWSLNCRRCKVNTRVGVGGVLVPPSEKKTNVAALVGYVLLLVFALVVGVLCFYCRYKNRGTTQRQEVVVQSRVPRVENIPQGQVLRQVRDRERRQHPLQPLPVNVERQSERGKEEVQHLYKENVGGKHGKGMEPKEQSEKKRVGGERANVRDGKQPRQVVEEQGKSSGLPEKYTFRYLQKVTNDFDPKNEIGKGGFGTVYKATLSDANGIKVAIKCLKFGGKIDDFKNEVDALGRASHSNLVRLIGYCAEGIIKFLVYEYMINGSLDKWIFHDNPRRFLTWPEMKNIIQGIAQALVYLHKDCRKTILHRDLKPQNVILDEYKNAKLCDLGIAKLLNKDQSSTSTACAGTPAYMAPEVMKNERITDKVDVYSFGVVVLEVMFGKRYKYLVSTYTSEVKLGDLIKNLGEDMRRNSEEIEKIGKLAVLCLREYPEERPTMSNILAAITRI